MAGPVAAKDAAFPLTAPPAGTNPQGLRTPSWPSHRRKHAGSWSRHRRRCTASSLRNSTACANTAWRSCGSRFTSSRPHRQVIKTAVSDWQIQATEQDGKELAGDRFTIPLNRPSPEEGAQAGTRATVTTQSRLPVLLKIVDDRQAARILRTLEADSRTNVLAAPKICVINGQSATVQDESQTVFVVGVKDGTSQRRFVSEGIRMGLRPLLRGDKVWLDLELRGAEITKVTKTAVKVAGREAELTLEIPEVRETKIDSAIEIPLGRTLLLNGPELRRVGKNAQSMLVSVRVDRIATETQAASVAADWRRCQQ